MWKWLPIAVKAVWLLVAGYGTVIGISQWSAGTEETLEWVAMNANLSGVVLGVSLSLLVAFVVVHRTQIASSVKRAIVRVPWLENLRSRMRATSPVKVVCLTLDTSERTVSRRTTRLRPGVPALIEFPYAKQPKYSIEIPAGYRLEFDKEDTRYHQPTTFAIWPEESVKIVLGDRPPPSFAQCKVTVHWVGE